MNILVQHVLSGEVKLTHVWGASDQTGADNTLVLQAIQELGSRILEGNEKNMATFKDELASAQEALTTEIGQINTGKQADADMIADLTARLTADEAMIATDAATIAELQAKLDAGELSAEDAASFEAFIQSLKNVVPDEPTTPPDVPPTDGGGDLPTGDEPSGGDEPTPSSRKSRK